MTTAPYALAVFDLDGVIVDSEPVHETVRGDLLYEISRGKTRTLGLDPTGTGTAGYYADFLRAHSAPGTGEEVARRHYKGVLAGIIKTLPEPIPGVTETLHRMQNAGVPMAVASSSPKFYVDGVLAHFRIEAYFCAVACGDEVEHLKPAPDVYQLALSRAGISPADALAVEDSHSGLLAAIAAGLACVGYAAPALRTQNLDGANLTVYHMRDFARAVLGELPISK